MKPNMLQGGYKLKCPLDPGLGKKLSEQAKSADSWGLKNQTLQMLNYKELSPIKDVWAHIFLLLPL